MSSDQLRCYLWVESLSTEGTTQLFSRAKEIKSQFNQGVYPQSLSGRQIVLFFSEASTRTKVSFQMAAQRLGAQCLVVDNLSHSSMSKGETFADTFWTLHANKPDLFIVRCGTEAPLKELASQ